jgi:hypothetical protein
MLMCVDPSHYSPSCRAIGRDATARISAATSVEQFLAAQTFFRDLNRQLQLLLLVQCDSTGKNVKQILTACRSDCPPGPHAGREVAREIRRFDALSPRMRARVFRCDWRIWRGQSEADLKSQRGRRDSKATSCGFP